MPMYLYTPYLLLSECHSSLISVIHILLFILFEIIEIICLLLNFLVRG